MDREKVINGLECCIADNFSEICDCPYQPSHKSCMCLFELHADALALLKAQETIDAIPMYWLDAQIRGYASVLKSTELKALIVVKGLWEKDQEAR